MNTISPATRQRLESLRNQLLKLHRLFMEDEQAAYERVHGRTAPAQLLQLLLKEPQFAWMRPVSELIVRIDELLEAREPSGDGRDLIGAARSLLVPDESGSEFGRKYYSVLQRVPDAVLLHGQLGTIFATN